MEENKFRKEIEAVINRCSMENGSNTPDFILAEFLENCLKAFDISMKKRSKWYVDSVVSELELRHKTGG